MALFAEDGLRGGCGASPISTSPPLLLECRAGGPPGRTRLGENRLHSLVVSAIASLGGVFALGRHLSGAATGFFALAFLGTSPGFFLHSHLVLPDMMLAAWITWALYFLLRALSGSDCPGSAWWRCRSDTARAASAARSSGVRNRAGQAFVDLLVVRRMQGSVLRYSIDPDEGRGGSRQG